MTAFLSFSRRLTEHQPTNQNLPFKSTMMAMDIYQSLFIMNRSIRTEWNINEAPRKALSRSITIVKMEHLDDQWSVILIDSHWPWPGKESASKPRISASGLVFCILTSDLQLIKHKCEHVVWNLSHFLDEVNLVILMCKLNYMAPFWPWDELFPSQARITTNPNWGQISVLLLEDHMWCQCGASRRESHPATL